MRYSDLHKTYIDNEHYNAGHGHAYEKYGVDPKVGAVVLVRPDQCKFFQTIQRGKC
jgi:phenol 2-monooxygenase